MAAAIEKGDYEVTGIEKSKIENEQRELRKKERDQGIEWQRRYFTRVDMDEKFAVLAERAGVVPEPERTGGMWVFDKEKYLKVEKKSADQQDSTTGTEAATTEAQALDLSLTKKHIAPASTPTQKPFN